MGLVHDILGQGSDRKVPFSYALGNAKERVKLPFLLGVIGDFSMSSRELQAPFAERSFLDIDRDNFDQVMAKLSPALRLEVPCTLMEAASESMLEVHLQFESLRDFEPLQVAQRIPALKRLIDQRRAIAKSSEAPPRRVEVELDAAISKQLAVVMHQPDFLKLEGSWRGLHYLVSNSQTGPDLKLRVLSCSKRELLEDLSQSGEIQDSRIYEFCDDPFCTRGDIPYSTLIVDFEFSHHADDVKILRGLAQVGADAQCPLVAAAAPKLFGLSSWGQLPSAGFLPKAMESVEYAAWNGLRKMEEARFLVLTLPRVLARAAYAAVEQSGDSFVFHEHDYLRHDQADSLCWMSAAFAYGVILTDAFAQFGWCTAVQGHEFGVVRHLPSIATNASGPTEVVIDDNRETELGSCGLLPLCQAKRLAIFFAAQTALKPKQYEGANGEEASANAAISARVPFVMATSRIAHYLRAIVRDKAGTFATRQAMEDHLNHWISGYVQSDPKPTRENMARWPLASAHIELSDVPKTSSFYYVAAYLRPVLILEELTASIRVAFVVPAR